VASMMGNMSSTCPSTALSNMTDGVERTRRNQVGLLQVYPHLLESDQSLWDIKTASMIGRASDAEIRLADDHVSRQHARLEVVPGGLRVIDLGSSHGTHVDGRAVATRGVVAHYGSVLRVGRALLLVVGDTEGSSAPIHRISGDFLGLAHDVLAGPGLWDTWQAASRVATLTYPVLIVGESGSGKEAVARILHSAQSSPGPFVSLNVAAIPGELIESEMLGRAQGTLKQAPDHRPGAFREASGGVLFLDEVADLRIESQSALLRVMDQGRVRPLGASADVPVQVRVIAATSRNLHQACQDGLFRQDLYYRLSSIVIRVPALRERRTDIIALAQAIIDAQPEQLSLSVKAAEALLLAPWEGNVRQLNNVVIKALVRALGSHGKQILPEHLSDMSSLPVAAATNEYTSRELVTALANAQGNASAAAKMLGVSRATLYNLFKRHGVDPRVVRRESG
jgi:two-component system, NtrC family, response regulator GlrR